jgi:C4-dicarboxylate transporter DctM subunit
VVNSIVTDVSIWTIFRGVWPFVVAMLLGLALIIAFPSIATFLPGYMSR